MNQVTTATSGSSARKAESASEPVLQRRAAGPDHGRGHPQLLRLDRASNAQSDGPRSFKPHHL